MLCTACERIFEDFVQDSNKRPHHETVADLESAAANYCWFCVIVLEELRRITMQSVDHIAIKRPLLQWSGFKNSSQSVSGVRISNRGTGIPKVNCSFYFLPISSRALCELEMAGEKDPLFGIGHHSDRIIPSNTGDPAVGKLALSWLKRCLNAHEKCDRNRDSKWFPPRLLDVTAQNPRLVITKIEPPKGPFATLSHCWGTNPTFLRLTGDRLEDMRVGIPLKDLPENFRNAVQICQSLQVKYLWIDSLCIIQSGEGSKMDWLHHVTTMRSIYSNSIVNIASTRAADATKSCFVERDPLHIKPHVINCRTPFSSKSDTVPHLVVYAELPRRGHQLTPLASRGWVLQERILAPRVLHFGTHQVFWECSESQNTCEAFPNGIPYQIFELPPFELPDKSDQGSDAASLCWQELIHTYTRCSLTKADTDKFVAFAGIVERMAAVFDDDYIAGFFRHELPRSLLWTIPRDFTPKASRKSAGVYRAPTWSWANTDVEIQLYEKYLEFYFYNSPPDIFLTTLIGHQVDLVDPGNKYGQLSRAELILSGRLVNLTWDNTSGITFTEFNVPELGYSARGAFFFFDSEADFYSDQKGVVILAIVGFYGGVDGLILRLEESKGTETYQRLGKGRLQGDGLPDRFAAIKERTILLI